MSGPLEGVRVIELAGLGPAPYASMLLAELGAEVVRVDRPGGSGLAAAPSEAMNRSRPNLAVDLKTDAGRDVVRRLVAQADVLVEGLRPGVTERLGIGPADCLAANPRLVYARMTGWGQSGPLAQRAGHDLTYAALTGALHITGEAAKPRPAANLVADFGGGTMFLLVGILSALHARTRTGRGQVVDAAMIDGASSLMTMVYAMYAQGAWVDERESNLLDGGTPFYDTYRCADGRFVAVGALEPQFYAQLLDGLGISVEGEQYDKACWPAQRAAFEAAFATRTRDEWDAVFAGTDACVAPVLSLAEAPDHPHLRARGVFTDAVDGHLQPRAAPRFSETPTCDPTPPRRPGQDTRAVLTAWGFADAEVEALLTEGAVFQAD